ncbi:MAG: flagellar hook capping FlgD N-terminal domain-containing protein [Sedimentisphaerales bacterium]
MSDTSSVTSASSIQANYMKLLVTQLQNQNPLEPMDNNQMASQLAQLSQLEQIETLNTKFSDVVAASQRSYAGSLIGKQVSFTVTDASGNPVTDDSGNDQIAGGTVNGIITQGSVTKLQVGDYTIGLDDVLTVI